MLAVIGKEDKDVDEGNWYNPPDWVLVQFAEAVMQHQAWQDKDADPAIARLESDLGDALNCHGHLKEGQPQLCEKAKAAHLVF